MQFQWKKEAILIYGISFKKKGSNKSNFNTMIEFIYIIGSVFLIKLIDRFRQTAGQFSEIFDLKEKKRKRNLRPNEHVIVVGEFACSKGTENFTLIRLNLCGVI
jgi:hypothetical protein